MAHPLQGICPFGLLAAHSSCCSSGKREAQMKTKTQICCFFFIYIFRSIFCHFAKAFCAFCRHLRLGSLFVFEPKPKPKPNPVTGRTRSSFAKDLRNLCNNLADFTLLLSSSLPSFHNFNDFLAIIISTSLRCFLSHFYSYLHLYCGIYLGIKFISTNVCVSRSIPVKEKFTQNNNNNNKK